MKRNLMLISTLTVLMFAPLRLAEAARLAPGQASLAQADATDAAREARVKTQLETLLSPVGIRIGEMISPAPADTVREVRIQWEAYPGAPLVVAPGQQPSGPTFTVSDQRIIKGGLTRQRSLEMSSTQMLVVAVNAIGQLKAWTLITDPRLLRVETPTAANELKGQVLHHSTPDFLVAIPNDPEIVELRFYHPEWTGKEFVLELLGSSAL